MSQCRLGSADLRVLARWAEAEGWAWSFAGSGHIRWLHPSVVGPIFTSASPRVSGGHKERQKLRTALRRAREGGSNAAA